MPENLGISLYDGKLYHPENFGLGTRGHTFDCPGHYKLRIDLSARSEEKSPVVMVHGFRYDPKSKGDNNPHNSTFQHWRKNIIKDASAYGFGWWSCPGKWFLPLSMWRAHKNHRWNTYRYAWDLAKEAGRTLSLIIAQSSGPITLLGHSLGSRVILSAIDHDPALPISRVVLMNGAELRKTALRIAKEKPHIKFYNLVVQEDDVLSKFGALFAPGDLYSITVGQAGLGIDAPKNWVDLNLDSLLIQKWARDLGWPGVQGDNPNGYFDHWWTHKHEGNWPLINALLTDWELVVPRS